MILARTTQRSIKLLFPTFKRLPSFVFFIVLAAPLLAAGPSGAQTGGDSTQTPAGYHQTDGQSGGSEPAPDTEETPHDGIIPRPAEIEDPSPRGTLDLANDDVTLPPTIAKTVPPPNPRVLEEPAALSPRELNPLAPLNRLCNLLPTCIESLQRTIRADYEKRLPDDLDEVQREKILRHIAEEVEADHPTVQAIEAANRLVEEIVEAYRTEFAGNRNMLVDNIRTEVIKKIETDRPEVVSRWVRRVADGGEVEPRLAKSENGDLQIFIKYKAKDHSRVWSSKFIPYLKINRVDKAMTTLLVNLPALDHVNTEHIDIKTAAHIMRYRDKIRAETGRDVTLTDLRGGYLMDAQYFEKVRILSNPINWFITMWRAAYQKPTFGQNFLSNVIASTSGITVYGMYYLAHGGPQNWQEWAKIGVAMMTSKILTKWTATYENLSRRDSAYRELLIKGIIKAVLTGYPIILIDALGRHFGGMPEVFTLTTIAAGIFSWEHLNMHLLGMGDNFASREMGLWVRAGEQVRAYEGKYPVPYKETLAALRNKPEILDEKLKQVDLMREGLAIERQPVKFAGHLTKDPIWNIFLWASIIPYTIYNDWRFSQDPRMHEILSKQRTRWLNIAVSPLMVHRYPDFARRYFPNSPNLHRQVDYGVGIAGEVTFAIGRGLRNCGHAVGYMARAGYNLTQGRLGPIPAF